MVDIEIKAWSSLFVNLKINFRINLQYVSTNSIYLSIYHSVYPSIYVSMYLSIFIFKNMASKEIAISAKPVRVSEVSGGGLNR